jgi:protein-histidine pros-kinase
MAFLVGIFLLITIVLNIMLRRFIIKPVTQIALMADKVSMGQMDATEFSINSKDEISVLATSFNRMRRSLQKAIKMLDR